MGGSASVSAARGNASGGYAGMEKEQADNTMLAARDDRRWQIETSYRELKQSMLGSGLTLRSRTVDGLY